MSEVVKQDAQKCDQDTISISFVAANSEKLNQNLDQLDSTFMYTQILKEILLTINFEEHIKTFTKYYREHFVDNTVQLDNIGEFEREYDKHCPVWWYTHKFCFYSLLNRALRMMEVDTIIKMGFFVCNLHEQITRLHSEQFSAHSHLQPFTTYRGQGLSETDFDRMLQTQGGLISFNNFLSTSKDPSVALGFAKSSVTNPTLVGIIFVINIDPSIQSTPYASIKHVSHYENEVEILSQCTPFFALVIWYRARKTIVYGK
jgi:hypothetical protein